MSFKLLTLFFFVFSQDLYARGAFLKKSYDNELLRYCKKRVNLAKKSWVVRTDVPQLNQGPVATCYAHAAASYMDVWRSWHLDNNTEITTMKLKLPTFLNRVSGSSWKNLKLHKRIGQTTPLWMGYLYKKYWPGKKKIFSSLDDGRGHAPLSYIISGKRGSCREDVFDNTMKKYSLTGVALKVNDFYAFTKWMMKKYDNKLQEIIDKQEGNWQKAFQEVLKMYAFRKRMKSFIKNADFEKVFLALKPHLTAENRNYLSFFEDVFKDCFDPKNHYVEFKDPKIRKYRVCSKFHKKQKNYIKSVAQLLDRNIPVGLSYVGKMLKVGPEKLGPREPGGSKTTHVSVLIGKRVRKGTCQFLLQNSWGNACGKYIWECQKDRNGNEIGVWIDAYELATYGAYTFHIDKKINKCKPQEL